MTDQDLAQLSNTAIYSAMVVLTLAMLAYAVYLARLAPTRGEQAGTDAVESRDGARELVGADGRAVATGSAAEVSAAVTAYEAAGVDHAVVMPLPWGTDRDRVIADTLAAAAPGA